MNPPHDHHHHAVSDDPGWSLLRLSAPVRLAFACGLSAVIWLATLAVMV